MWLGDQSSGSNHRTQRLKTFYGTDHVHGHVNDLSMYCCCHAFCPTRSGAAWSGHGSRLDREIGKQLRKHLLLFDFPTHSHHGVAQVRVPAGLDAISAQG